MYRILGNVWVHVENINNRPIMGIPSKLVAVYLNE